MLWLILVPVARPAIVTLLVLTFMWTWNEFLIPLVMVPTNESLRTAPLGLGFFSGQYTQGTALLAAGATIVALRRWLRAREWRTRRVPSTARGVFLHSRQVAAGLLDGLITRSAVVWPR